MLTEEERQAKAVAYGEWRARIHQAFQTNWQARPYTYVCRVCGMGPITALGRISHLRWHEDDPMTRLAKMHETVEILWG